VAVFVHGLTRCDTKSGDMTDRVAPDGDRHGVRRDRESVLLAPPDGRRGSEAKGLDSLAWYAAA
jgi:hypothetical protein